KQDAKEHRLTGAADAAFVIARKHAKAGALVIMPAHPSNCEKMRHLPDEENGKERPGGEIKRPGRRRPSDKRRDGARDGANERVRGGDAFQWRVGENINE